MGARGKVTRMLQQEIITWEEALQGFLLRRQAMGLSKTTLNDYRRHVVRFFKCYPQSWQEPGFKQVVMEYMAADVKPATFNLRLIYLRTFFDWCLEEGYLAENPLAGFKKRKAQPRIVDVSEDTLQRLIELPNQSTFAGLRDYALIMFTLDTGIRPKEAFSLKAEDFDLKSLIVAVPAEEAKTRTARVLPILLPTAEAVRKLIRARHPAWSKDIPVFCTTEGTVLNACTWGDRLEMYSDKLGVKVRPYDLRHSFALLYLRNGGHAFGLQRMLGHSDMSMTKRYVSLTQQDLREQHISASPLNSLLPKKQRLRKITR